MPHRLKSVYPWIFGHPRQLLLNRFFDPSTSLRKVDDGGKTGGGVILFIVATNVVASRPPERRPTGTELGKKGKKEGNNDIIVATNVVASRLPDHRPTGTPTARANCYEGNMHGFSCDGLHISWTLGLYMYHSAEASYLMQELVCVTSRIILLTVGHKQAQHGRISSGLMHFWGNRTIVVCLHTLSLIDMILGFFSFGFLIYFIFFIAKLNLNSTQLNSNWGWDGPTHPIEKVVKWNETSNTSIEKFKYLPSSF